jgi:uncharacterized membrane protein required for colicin V production
MKFHFIDLLLIAGLVFGVFLGFRGGVTKKIFNVLSLIGSIVAATYLMAPIGGIYHSLLFSSESVSHIMGFVTVVAAFMTAAILLYRKFGSAEMAKSTSQVLGMVLGAFEAALLTSLILIMLKVLDSPADDTRESSLLYKPLANFLPKTFDMMKSYLPGASGFREEMSRTFKDVDIFEQVSETGGAL